MTLKMQWEMAGEEANLNCDAQPLNNSVVFAQSVGHSQLVCLPQSSLH